MKSGAVVKTVSYNLDANNPIKEVSIEAPEMSSTGTITLAAKANAVAFSGVCI